MSHKIVALLAVASAMACKATEQPKPAPAAESSPPPPAPAPIETIPEREVRQVVDDWLAAQNDGDFDAYQRVYAARMTGIKRVGPRTRTFDRAGWMKDRERMFARPMQVTIADVGIRSMPRSALVRFEQTWSSGKFEDVGPKELVVVREAGGLRIAREEMLASTVIGRPGAADPPEAGTILPIIEVGGTRHAVLALDWPVDRATGPARRGDAHTALRQVAGADVADWKGRAVTGFGPQPCAGTLGTPVAVSGAEPHFGEVQAWEERKASDDAIAAELWAMGRVLLVAPVEVECDQGWVSLVPAERTRLLPRTEDDDAAARAARAFEQLPAYGQIQRELEADEGADAGPWLGRATRSITMFRDQPGKRHLVVIRQSGGDGCGAWSGALAAIVAVPDAGKPEVLTAALDPFFAAESAFDLEGDGDLELYGQGQLLGADGAVYLDATFPSYDCPC